MQSVVEAISDLKRKINITVPATELSNAYGKKVNEVALTAKVDGFRPGKFPKSRVETMYGPSIKADVVDEIVRKSFDKVCVEKKIEVAGIDNVDVTKSEIGQDLEFSVNIEVYPEITFADSDFANITVDKNVVTVSDNDVETQLEKLLKGNATWENADSSTVAKNGDKVVLDFVGTSQGKEIDGGTAKDFEVEIGSKHLINGFEDGIIGHKAGDEFELNLKFPDDYHENEYAGKEAIFKVTLKQVKHATLPAVDEEFCKKFGVLPAHNHVHDEHCSHAHDEVSNADEDYPSLFKAKLKESLEKELKNKLAISYKNAVLKALKEHKSISIPQSAIDAEINSLIKQQNERYRRYTGNKNANLELDRAKFAEAAQSNVHASLLVMAFIKQNDIKTSREIIKAKLTDLMGMDNISDEILDWYYSDQRRISEVQALALEDLVIDAITQKINVVEKPLSYSQFVEKN